MEGIPCPHCGVVTSYAPVEHRKMVQLDKPANWQTVHLASGSIHDRKSGYWFGLARCQACDEAFAVRGKAANNDNPDQTYHRGSIEALWPTRYRAVPQEIPSPIREAMADASAALGAGSIIGAMLACRTAIIRAQRHVKKEMKLPEASLKAIYEAGRISKFEYGSSDLARRWANYLGHEEPDPEKVIDLNEAKEFYGYIESLLDSMYVKWKRLRDQQAKLAGEGSS